jgi:hypothetical protein
MDPILSAKRTSMADAFGLLLAIRQGPTGLSKGRIHRRMMTYDGCQFHQYIYHEKSASDNVAWSPVRYLSAEFRQWDGYFNLYGHTHEEIKKYLPKQLSLSDIKQGFNHERFFGESIGGARMHSLKQIEEAAEWAIKWLIGEIEWPDTSIAQMAVTVKQIDAFKRSINSTSAIPVRVSDLVKLMGT